jgi:hypothetical protein
LDALRNWFAPRAIDVDYCGDSEAARAYHAVQRCLADYAEGFLSEPQLKLHMGVAFFPSPSLSSFQQIHIGDFVPSPISGSSVVIEGSPSVFVGGGRALELVS